jgi:hypothetical protein
MTPATTCGQGLAAHARLPTMLANVMSAVSDVLEHHITALDLGDPSSRREGNAYASLVGRHRECAGTLRDIAREMDGYRDLPMGRHDSGAMMQPRAREVLEQLVSREEELAAALREWVEQYRTMLQEMPT